MEVMTHLLRCTLPIKSHGFSIYATYIMVCVYIYWYLYIFIYLFTYIIDYVLYIIISYYIPWRHDITRGHHGWPGTENGSASRGRTPPRCSEKGVPGNPWTSRYNPSTCRYVGPPRTDRRKHVWKPWENGVFVYQTWWFCSDLWLLDDS
jgi:hypothetical protein